ncbi:MAG: TonB-dependent receptor [Planctomycetota bacterium]|nr:MAG: TonB-dependent receptor [Planctomycetota bacterium]
MDARKLLRAVSFTVPIFTLPIFAGAFVGAARLAAQETGSAQPPAQSQNAADELPSLPETRVLAKPSPGPFPREPLPDDASVTATRTETLTSQVGSAISVITEEQIRKSGQTTLLGVLRSAGVPGIDFAQTGGPGSVTTGFIRGANAEHTKVLLDGIPLNDPSSPKRAFDFGGFSLDNVERIEILRGAQSTLYGSDAIGGVVNIVTKRGQGPAQFRFSSLGGTFGTWQESAGVSGGNDRYYYSVNGSFLNTDGFSAASKRFGNREDDSFRNGNLGLRAGYIVNENFDLDVVYRYQKARAEIDDAFDPGTFFSPLDSRNFNNLESNVVRTQLRSLLFDGALEQKVGFNFVNYNRDATFFFDAGSPSVPFFFDGETRKLDYQANWKTFESETLRNTATLGLEYLDERTTTDFGPTRFAQQDARSVFVQDQIALWDRWFTTAGYRHDDYSLAGAADTFRVTSRYQVLETNTAFHSSYGTGFRAPAIPELFGFSGNPDLKPEHSKGWDIGVEQAFDANRRLVIDATYFRNDFTDLITFGPPPTFANLNIASALATGVEVTGQWQAFDNTSLSAAYTYTDATNQDTGTRLLRRPANKFGIGIDQYFLDRRANLNFNLRRVGHRDDFDPFTFGTRELERYTVANVQGYFDWNKSVRLFGRIDNVFDEKYEEVFAFATPRFSVFAGVTILLGGDDDGL